MKNDDGKSRMLGVFIPRRFFIAVRLYGVAGCEAFRTVTARVSSNRQRDATPDKNNTRK